MTAQQQSGTPTVADDRHPTVEFEHPVAATANSRSSQMPPPVVSTVPTVPKLPTIPVAPTIPTTPAAPPVVEQRPPPWRRTALFSVLALLVGVGVGYAAGLPGKAGVRGERDDALAMVESLEDELDTTSADLASTHTALSTAAADLLASKGELTATQGDLATVTTQLDGVRVELDGMRSDFDLARADLATARTDLDTVTANRDVCEQAAGDGMALVDEWNNVFGDIVNWMATAVGSEAEATLDIHIADQLDDMDQAYWELGDLVNTCTAG